MAQITVRYFAAAAEAAGVEEEPWELGEDPTLGELRRGLSERYGTAMSRVLRAGSFLVDGTVRRVNGERRVNDERGAGGERDTDDADSVLREGAVVDVLPPFAGG